MYNYTAYEHMGLLTFSNYKIKLRLKLLACEKQKKKKQQEKRKNKKRKNIIRSYFILKIFSFSF